MENRNIEYYWGLFKTRSWYTLPENEKTEFNAFIKSKEFVWWYNFIRPQKKLGYLSPYQYLKERLDMNNKEHVKLLNKIEAMKIRVEEHIISLRGSTKKWA
ncbi:MAG: hypothetical protein LBH55_02540 [Mycoplasmataceae bacterium]|nr:hypothetical protein [Mycoplasmataceae bacterium]